MGVSETVGRAEFADLSLIGRRARESEKGFSQTIRCTKSGIDRKRTPPLPR